MNTVQKDVNPKLKKFTTGKLYKTGQKALNKKDHQKALAIYYELWDREPDNKEVLVVLAFLLAKLAYREQAILLLESALETFGPREDILQILGDMAMTMEMFELAEKVFRICIDTYPLGLVAYNNLTSVLTSLERFDEAIDLMKELLEVYPENATFWNTLASSVSTRDGEENGLIFYEEAHRLDPQNPDVMNNIARARLYLGHIDEAIEMAEKVVEININAFDTRFLLGNCYLQKGWFEKGWPFYEARLDARRTAALIYTNNIPEWHNEPLKGKSILIMSEQGLGDEMVFASAIKHVYEQAEQTYIGCDPRLIPLYQRTFPKAKICPHVTAKQKGHIMRSYPEFEIARNAGELSIDYRIAIASIPLYFWNDLKSIPNYKHGYLKPDPKRVKHWQKKLDAISDKPKVGITWRSGLMSATRNIGYTQITDWETILKTDEVDFINMQYGECSEEIAEAEKKFGVKIHQMEGLDLKQDIDDSCALFKCFDLVLAPANAPSWQAACVGTPVWWLTGQPFWFFGQQTQPVVNSGHYIERKITTNVEDYMVDVGAAFTEYLKTGDRDAPYHLYNESKEK